MKRKLNKKGSITMFIIFLTTSLLIILVSAFAAPMSIRFNTEMYRAGERLVEQSNESIANINNETVRQSIQNTLAGGLNNVENNIEVGNALFQYGWILVLGLTLLVVFLYTRRVVEIQSGGLI